ncbi:putative baseplate protein [Vibrio phage Rostov M3]|uniref:Putative baseplate protein n=1 Tax=Vibrio phage Rostov M3 TaxID=2660724 RepID=A0A5Q2WEC1_9CAUD|nr:putative baseplate protein [Vibrio phage Rostov M3]
MNMNSKRTELMKRSFIELMKDVGTSIPGHFLAFDPDTQLAQIQIGIQRVDVNGKVFEPAPLIECPVAFLGGSEYFIEHQIDPGDECLIVFSQRCIDGWINTGGIADNHIMRFHDFNDAAILPGLRSQPNKISSFENNGVRLRNKSGDKYIWLKNDGTAEITVDTLRLNGDFVHTGDTNHTGNTIQSGDLTVSGTIIAGIISAMTSLLIAGKEMLGHIHSGVTRGNQNTDGPV